MFPITRALIIVGLLVAVVADFVSGGFHSMDAPQWAALFSLLATLGLLIGSALLALQALRGQDEQRDLAALGFAAVGLYALARSAILPLLVLLSRELPEVHVGLIPWAVLALGLILISMSDRFVSWVRGIGLVAAVAFAVAQVQVVFGAELSSTGDLLPTVMVGSILLYVTLIGWTIDVWKAGSR